MNEETVVVQNGVTVRKSFSADDFPVPAVTFGITSTRDEPLELRLTDSIPEGFGVEQIGFHPDYGSEHWTATGEGGVRFERTVEPGEEFTTVYGVRMNEDDEPTIFLEKPEVEVNPAEAAETADVVPEESSEVVRELARGERDTVPGLESDASTAEPEPSDSGAKPPAAGADSAEPEPGEDEGAAAESPAADPAVANEAEGGTETDLEAETGTESADEVTVGSAAEPADTASSEPVTEPMDTEAASSEPVTEPMDTEAASSEPVTEPMDTEAASSEPDAETSETDLAEELGATEATGDSGLTTAGSTNDLRDEGDAAESEREREPPEESESGIEDPETDLEEAEPAPDTRATDTGSESSAATGTDTVVEGHSDGAGTTPDETAATNDSPTRAMPSETDTDSIVAAFAEEIEAGTIDDGHLSVIREALLEERPSDQVRLEHLQSRVSDLEAYTDALESFLDEEGGGQQVLDDLEAEIRSFEAELADMGARLDAAAAERDTMSEHLENLENTVEALAGVAEQIERVRDDVEALDERLADVEGVSTDVSDLEAELDAVRADLTEVTEWRDQLSDVFGP